MRIKSNAVTYDIKTLHGRLVPVLESLDKVCREHHLRYYLWAGTMLGAVRHKGFIPWDDDMDICMPRPDYETLLAHCHEWMPAPFEVIGPHNRPDYPYPFAKVEDGSTTVIERPDFNFPEGIYVDIFPLDGIPSDPDLVKCHLETYKFYRHLLFFRGRDPFKHGKGPRSWWPLLIHKVFSMKWLQDKVHSLMTKYSFDDYDEVIDYDSCECGIIRKEWLSEPKPYEFEGKTFMGLSDADKYLTHMYGDYMTPPPKEKQIQHEFLLLDFDMPYREYIKKNNIKIGL